MNKFETMILTIMSCLVGCGGSSNNCDSILITSPVTYKASGFYWGPKEVINVVLKDRTSRLKETKEGCENEILKTAFKSLKSQVSSERALRMETRINALGAKGSASTDTAINLKNELMDALSDEEKTKFSKCISDASASQRETIAEAMTGNDFLHFNLRLSNHVKRDFSYDREKGMFKYRIKLRSGHTVQGEVKNSIKLPAHRIVDIPLSVKLEDKAFNLKLQEYLSKMEFAKGDTDRAIDEVFKVEIASDNVPLIDAEGKCGISYPRENVFVAVDVKFGEASSWFPQQVRLLDQNKKKISLRQDLDAISGFLDANYNDAPKCMFRFGRDGALSEVYELPFGCVLDDDEIVVMNSDGRYYLKVTNDMLSKPPSARLQRVNVSFEKLTVRDAAKRILDFDDDDQVNVAKCVEVCYERRKDLQLVESLVEYYQQKGDETSVVKWRDRLPVAKNSKGAVWNLLKLKTVIVPSNVVCRAVSEKGGHVKLADSQIYLDVFHNGNQIWRSPGVVIDDNGLNSGYVFANDKGQSTLALPWRDGDELIAKVMVAEKKELVRANNAIGGGVGGAAAGAVAGAVGAGVCTGGLGALPGAGIGAIVGAFAGAGLSQAVPVTGAREVGVLSTDRVVNERNALRLISTDGGVKINFDSRRLTKPLKKGELRRGTRYLVCLNTILLNASHKGVKDGKYYAEIWYPGREDAQKVDLGELKAGIENTIERVMLIENRGGNIMMAIKRDAFLKDPLVFWSEDDCHDATSWLFMDEVKDEDTSEKVSFVKFETYSLDD